MYQFFFCKRYIFLFRGYCWCQETEKPDSKPALDQRTVVYRQTQPALMYLLCFHLFSCTAYTARTSSRELMEYIHTCICYRHLWFRWKTTLENLFAGLLDVRICAHYIYSLFSDLIHIILHFLADRKDISQRCIEYFVSSALLCVSLLITWSCLPELRLRLPQWAAWIATGLPSATCRVTER